MDAASCNWNTTKVQESFARARPSADTLSKLAKLVARAEHKSADSRGQSRQHPLTSHLPTCGCVECSHVFSNMTDLLQQHQEGEHALPKPHQCLSCGKQFSLLSSLQLHKCVHDSPSCHVCHGEPQLGAHCSACTNPESPQDKSPLPHAHRLDCSPYACAPCGRGFSQKQALLYHQQAGCSEPSSPQTVEDGSSPPADSPPAVSEARSSPSDASDTTEPESKATVCPICSKTFRTGVALNCHQRFGHQKKTLVVQRTRSPKAEQKRVVERPAKASAKSKQKLLSCRSCDMVFVGTAKLYMHRKEKHSRDKDTGRMEPTPIKRRKDETYPCLVCGRIFLHHLSLQVHAKQHAMPQNADQRPVKTAAAERKPKKLKKHHHNNVGVDKTAKLGVRQGQGKHHKEPKVEDDVDGEFPCPSCAEVFSFQSELIDHVELHQPSACRGNCSVCTQGMDVVKGPGSKKQRLYHCSPCQRAFSLLETFLQHCQDHLRVRVDEERNTADHSYQGNKD